MAFKFGSSVGKRKQCFVILYLTIGQDLNLALSNFDRSDSFHHSLEGIVLFAPPPPHNPLSAIPLP